MGRDYHSCEKGTALRRAAEKDDGIPGGAVDPDSWVRGMDFQAKPLPEVPKTADMTLMAYQAFWVDPD